MGGNRLQAAFLLLLGPLRVPIPPGPGDLKELQPPAWKAAGFPSVCSFT